MYRCPEERGVGTKRCVVPLLLADTHTRTLMVYFSVCHTIFCAPPPPIAPPQKKREVNHKGKIHTHTHERACPLIAACENWNLTGVLLVRRRGVGVYEEGVLQGVRTIFVLQRYF